MLYSKITKICFFPLRCANLKKKLSKKEDFDGITSVIDNCSMINNNIHDTCCIGKNVILSSSKAFKFFHFGTPSLYLSTLKNNFSYLSYLYSQ